MTSLLRPFSPTGKYIIGLDHRTAGREEITGGKGANIARLYQHGFRVPPTVIITTSVYKRVLKKYQPPFYSTLFRTIGHPMEGSVPPILKFQFPADMMKKLHQIPEILQDSLAVRSSVVGEDGSLASFAGQLDTFLNVEGTEALILAIKKCYHGLLNHRFQKYRHHFISGRKVNHQASLSMAIVIQKMVRAQAAGIAFSANPMTGQNCIIIEATRGLGADLAAGKINPDRYLIDPHTRVLYQKHLASSRPVLTKQQISDLSEIIIKISDLFRNPQDIEWAWDGHQFFVLQTRPITANPSRRIYSRKLVSDMTPGLIKPLVWSTNILDMNRNVFGRLLRPLFRSEPVDTGQIVKLIHSRVYANMAFFSQIFSRLGMPPNFFDMMVRDEKSLIKKPKLSGPFLVRLVPLLWLVLRLSHVKKEVRNFFEIHHARLEYFRNRDWSQYAETTLFQTVHRLRLYHRHTQWYMWIGAMNMTIRNKLLNKLVKKYTPQEDPRDLIRGLLGLKSLEPNREMQKLGVLLRKLDPEIRRLWDKGDFQRFRTHLDGTVTGREFHDAYEKFMKNYGYLSTNGTDFSLPSWIENPAPVRYAISRFAREESPVNFSEIRRIREKTLRNISAGLRGWQNLLFRHLLKSTQTYLNLREKMSFYMSEDTFQMRRLYLTLGEKLASASKLKNSRDIFYLNYKELFQLIHEQVQLRDLHQKIRERQQRMERDFAVNPPETLCDDMISSPEILDKHHLQGIAASSGLVMGYARVVRDPTEIQEDLSHRDILVVPFTDVGWTPLFPSVGGLVTETGGQLSHSAIIAREYGLPAVVGVRYATHLIKNGQPLTVDGNFGRVYLGHHSIETGE